LDESRPPEARIWFVVDDFERQLERHVLFPVRIGCYRSGIHLKTGLLIRWSWFKPLKKNQQDDSQTLFKAEKSGDRRLGMEPANIRSARSNEL